MKKISLLLLFLPALETLAQKQVPMNTDAATFYNKAIAGIKPLYKNYVTQNSTALRNRNINADSLRKATKANALFAKMNKADIEVMTLLILQAAKADVYEDLANLRDEMKKTRQKTEAIGLQTERLIAERKKADSNKGKKETNMDLKKELERMKKELEAMESISTDQQLKLQLLMEKKNQLETTISNMMKMAGDAQSGISDNLK